LWHAVQVLLALSSCHLPKEKVQIILRLLCTVTS
jgi:hypothetical protein